jgi:hypothetical protein
MFRYRTIQEAMIAIEASIGQLAQECQEQALKCAPTLDADDRSALTFAAHMLPSCGIVQAGPTDEAPRHQSPKDESAPRQGHRPEHSERQRTQE